MLLEPDDQLVIYQIQNIGEAQFLGDFITSYFILGSL